MKKELDAAKMACLRGFLEKSTAIYLTCCKVNWNLILALITILEPLLGCGIEPFHDHRITAKSKSLL